MAWLFVACGEEIEVSVENLEHVSNVASVDDWAPDKRVY
jgi:hypothetical protein